MAHPKLTVEEWKAAVAKSSHVYATDTLNFNESNGVITASVTTNKDRYVFLGCYFLKDIPPNIQAGTGWFHP